MKKKSKRYKNLLKSKVKDKKPALKDILDLVKKNSSVNFEESFVGIFSENRKNLKIANLGVSSYSPKIFYSKLNYLLSEGFKFKEIIFQ